MYLSPDSLNGRYCRLQNGHIAVFVKLLALSVDFIAAGLPLPLSGTAIYPVSQTKGQLL